MENSYTKLVAWSLSPDVHGEGLATRMQKAWLCSLGIAEASSIRHPEEPVPFLLTEDGIPDLVFKYPNFVVVVEAKTGTGEHSTPSGQPQSVAYPESVSKALRLAASTPVYMVYLTPSGESAANEDAIATTYVAFAVALASGLREENLSPEVLVLMKLLITHLVCSAVPVGLNLRLVFGNLKSIIESRSEAEKRDMMIAGLRGFNTLIELCRSLDNGQV
jgi:hypothetical protein